MPIEIRELVIRATVVDKGSEPAKEEKPGSGAPKDIVAECVEQVMRILRAERER